MSIELELLLGYLSIVVALSHIYLHNDSPFIHLRTYKVPTYSTANMQWQYAVTRVTSPSWPCHYWEARPYRVEKALGENWLLPTWDKTALRGSGEKQIGPAWIIFRPLSGPRTSRALDALIRNRDMTLS